jgi:hypothetical protein
VVGAILEQRSSKPSLGRNAVRSPEGRILNVTFKITRALLSTIRFDLAQPHRFAHERVGFISAGLSAAGDDVLVLARDYRPVEDDDYLRDPSVGAMMGPHAIRKALQWAMQRGHALFHVHTHGGYGQPAFSSVDKREAAKFVLDFFKVAPQSVHGALVLSDTSARGHVWLGPKMPRASISRFAEVGAPIRKWSSP